LSKLFPLIPTSLGTNISTDKARIYIAKRLANYTLTITHADHHNLGKPTE